MTLGGGEVTNGNKWRLFTVPTPIQPGDLTSRTAPPRVEKEVGRAPPRVKMAPSRVNVEVSVTGPPARYKLSVKLSTRTTISNCPAQNTISARATGGLCI